MSLKRSGLGAQAVLWGALGFALLAWLGVTIAALVIDGDWQHIFLNAAWGFFIFMPIVFLVILVMLLIAFVNLPRRRQILLRAGDPLMTPPAPQQPDPALALHTGETLTFGWRQPASTTLTGLLVGPLLGAFVALSGEVMVFSTIPAFGSTSLNPFYDAFGDTLGPPPTPTPLDWIAAAFPIAFGLLVLSLSLWATLAGRRARITADDRGITYQRSFQRTRFIPWNDIHVLIRRSQTKDGSAGDYYVWGSDYGIVFTVNPKITVPATSQRGARQRNSGFIYEGGYETYIRDAARLLATISARSFVPLHITRVGERANQGMSRRFPLLTLTLEDIQNAPLATAPLQPDMSAAPHVAEIKLNARIFTRRFWAEVVVWMFVFAALVVLFDRHIVVDFGQLFSDGPLAVSAATAFLAFMLVLLAMMPPLVIRSARAQQDIIADVTGLKRLSGEGSTAVPWEDIRAWGVVPPPPGSNKAARYLVMTEAGLRFTWREPANAQLGGRGVQGDRQAAYRQRADALHALIVARTGLPLHDLTDHFAQR